MRRRKDPLIGNWSAKLVFLLIICVWTVIGQDTITFNEVPKEFPGTPRRSLHIDQKAPSKNGLESLFDPIKRVTFKPAWARHTDPPTSTPPISTTPPEWDLVPGEGDSGPAGKLDTTTQSSNPQGNAHNDSITPSPPPADIITTTQLSTEKRAGDSKINSVPARDGTSSNNAQAPIDSSVVQGPSGASSTVILPLISPQAPPEPEAPTPSEHASIPPLTPSVHTSVPPSTPPVSSSVPSSVEVPAGAPQSLPSQSEPQSQQSLRQLQSSQSDLQAPSPSPHPLPPSNLAVQPVLSTSYPTLPSLLPSDDQFTSQEPNAAPIFRVQEDHIRSEEQIKLESQIRPENQIQLLNSSAPFPAPADTFPLDGNVIITTQRPPELLSTFPRSNNTQPRSRESATLPPVDDYSPDPDVFPFTVSEEELMGGRTADFTPQRATVETPRPVLQADQRSAFFASFWAPWSPWSECQNNERVRVRACNTIVGFSCFGKNKETRICNVPTTTRSPSTFPLDPNNPNGEQQAFDQSSEFGQAPGGPRLFIIRHTAITAAPPVPQPVDDYTLDGENLSGQRFDQPQVLQQQVKFQAKVEKVTAPKPVKPATRPPRPTTKQQRRPPQVAKKLEESKKSVKTPPKAGSLGGSISPAGENPLPGRQEVRPPAKGNTRQPKIRLANPADEDTTTAASGEETTTAGGEVTTTTSGEETTTATSVETTSAAAETTPSGGETTASPSGEETTSPASGETSPVTESTASAPSAPSAPGAGGAKVKPSGYVPNPGFGGGEYVEPAAPSYGAPQQSSYGGYGQPAARPRPNVPTGFDQAQWGNWGPWGPCVCGKRARTRACDYSTAYLTEGCDGNSYELQPCSGAPCGETGCGAGGCGGGGYGGGGGGGCTGGNCALQGGGGGGGCTGGNCGLQGGGGGCTGGNCALQGGPPTLGCPGGVCGGGGGAVAVNPPFPYPPLPPGDGGSCVGGKCSLQGGPGGNCAGGSCGPSGGYSGSAGGGYGQSGCTGSGCALQGGGDSGGCAGGACGQPATGYQPPRPPAGYSSCSGGDCALQGGSGIQAPTVQSTGGCIGGACGLQGGDGGSAGPACSGPGCSILSGSGGPIMIKAGGSGGYSVGGCTGGGCGVGPSPPGGYGGGGCAGGDCALQGGPAGGIGGGGGCAGGNCGAPSPPGGYGPAPPAPPSGYGGGCSGGDCGLQGGPPSPPGGCAGGNCGQPDIGYQGPPLPPGGGGGGGCSGGGCGLQGGVGIGGPILPPVVGGYAPSSGGCTGGGCAIQGGGGGGGCTGGGCAIQGGGGGGYAPSSGGCTGGGCAIQGGGGGYGSPDCPPSAVGADYKQLQPVETIRMDGVMQPLGFTAPPGQVATTPPVQGPPAYGAPGQYGGGGPSEQYGQGPPGDYGQGPSGGYAGKLRHDDPTDAQKNRPGTLVEAEEESSKETSEGRRRRRRHLLSIQR